MEMHDKNTFKYKNYEDGEDFLKIIGYSNTDIKTGNNNLLEVINENKEGWKEWIDKEIKKPNYKLRDKINNLTINQVYKLTKLA